MARWIINGLSVGVIALSALAWSVAPAAAGGSSCETPSGGKCTGSCCCVIDDACYANCCP